MSLKMEQEMKAEGMNKEVADGLEVKVAEKKEKFKFPVKPDVERFPRTEAVMKKEADWLAAKIAELEEKGKLEI